MMRMELADIGKTIRAERRSKALTQSRLAEMAGVSRATLNGLEKGTIKELGFLRLHRIMSILGYELAPIPAAKKASPSPEILRRMARRYVWWQSPADAVKDPRRIIAQVMDIGTLEDLQALAMAFGKTALVDALRHARPGWFRPKSWVFWHKVLMLETGSGIPPMPKRRLDALSRPA
jgi:transcriptional regulator with XRE-family HTH domain